MSDIGLEAFESALRLGQPGYGLIVQTHYSHKAEWIHVYEKVGAALVTCCDLDMVSAGSRARWLHKAEISPQARWCPVCVSVAYQNRGKFL